MKMARWFWLSLLVSYFIIGVVIYWSSLAGPWQYDDHAQILDKPVLTAHTAGKFFLNAFRILPEENRLTNRDVVRASFRLNWDWWGEETAGYRWINLGIHVVNALLVAMLVWLLFEQRPKAKGQRLKEIQRSSISPIFHPSSFSLAVLSGLLFLVHPIQSQAVAYIAQRFTSMATMFYLVAVVSFIKSIKSRGGVGWKWFGIALLSGILAFSSKEISVTLPVAILLISLVLKLNSSSKNLDNKVRLSKKQKKKLAKQQPFIEKSGSWKMLIILLIPFFLIAVKIPFQVAWSSANRSVSNLVTGQVMVTETFALKQRAEELTQRDYFLTQINVIRTYLRLIILPVGQNLDWDYPITTQLDAKTGLSGLLHLGLITVGLWLILPGQRLKAKGHPSSLRLLGAGILWFYLTILPESSLIPIIDVIYEHRVYLPMVGICIVLAGIGSAIMTYKSSKTYMTYITAAASIWLLLLSTATMRRAWIWGDQIRLWADVYTKAPEKARANKNYGVVLAADGQYSQGIERLERAVELDSDNADYWSNLGTAYLRAELFEEAAPNFQKAYQLHAAQYGFPEFGSEEELIGPLNVDKAEQAAQYLNDYGVAMVRLERGEEALAAFQQALEIDGGLYAAWLGLGAAKNILDDIDGAISIFEQLVERAPDQPDGYKNLVTMYRKAGRDDDARAVELRLQQIPRGKIEK